MKVILIRHAAAVPSGTTGVADDDRPLTPKGKTKFRAAAKGLARIADRPDALLTSPLPRARETADIAAAAFKRIQLEVEPALARGGVPGILAALARRPADATVALVGHEPTLSALLARLLGAADGERVAFKKGGVALVDLPDGPNGPARLVWFLKPKILRTLGED